MYAKLITVSCAYTVNYVDTQEGNTADYPSLSAQLVRLVVSSKSQTEEQTNEVMAARTVWAQPQKQQPTCILHLRTQIYGERWAHLSIKIITGVGMHMRNWCQKWHNVKQSLSMPIVRKAVSALNELFEEPAASVISHWPNTDFNSIF